MSEMRMSGKGHRRLSAALAGAVSVPGGEVIMNAGGGGVMVAGAGVAGAGVKVVELGESGDGGFVDWWSVGDARELVGGDVQSRLMTVFSLSVMMRVCSLRSLRLRSSCSKWIPMNDSFFPDRTGLSMSPK